MKQTLAVKLGQQLKMTPQLQQAIKLLQMSSLELTEEIENALEENPLLEKEDEQEMFVDDSSPIDMPDFSEGIGGRFLFHPQYAPVPKVISAQSYLQDSVYAL